MTNTLKTLLLAAGIGLVVGGCSTKELNVKIPEGKGYILYDQNYKRMIVPIIGGIYTKITYIPDSTRKEGEIFYDRLSDGIGNDENDYYSVIVDGDKFRQYQIDRVTFEDSSVVERNGMTICDTLVTEGRRILANSFVKYGRLKQIVQDSLLNRVKSVEAGK